MVMELWKGRSLRDPKHCCDSCWGTRGWRFGWCSPALHNTGWIIGDRRDDWHWRHQEWENETASMYLILQIVRGLLLALCGLVGGWWNLHEPPQCRWSSRIQSNRRFVSNVCACVPTSWQGLSLFQYFLRGQLVFQPLDIDQFGSYLLIRIVFIGLSIGRWWSAKFQKTYLQIMLIFQ